MSIILIWRCIDYVPLPCAIHLRPALSQLHSLCAAHVPVEKWQRHLDASSHIDDCYAHRFGVLNKVVLLFPFQWWDDHDTFGHVADAEEDPGWCYLWYCFPGLSGMLADPACPVFTIKAVLVYKALSYSSVATRGYNLVSDQHLPGLLSSEAPTK
jgi:hypothetical protein